MKVKEIIQFFIDLHSKNLTIESYCKIFDLDNHLDTKFINLSYSNKRKIMFAITIINNPKLLLLDNPLNGVDIISRNIIWRNLKYLFQHEYKCSTLLATNLKWEKEIIENNNGILSCQNEERMDKYILYIEFEESLIKQNDIISETDLNNLRRIVTDIDNFFDYFSNPKISSCLKILYNFLSDNILMTNHLKINDIEYYYFKLIVGIVNGQKKYFFEKLINMKKNNKFISQIKIKKYFEDNFHK